MTKIKDLRSKKPKKEVVVRATWEIEMAPEFCAVDHMCCFEILREDSGDYWGFNEYTGTSEKDVAMQMLESAIPEVDGTILRLCDRADSGMHKHITRYFANGRTYVLASRRVKCVKRPPFRNRNTGNMVQEVDFVIVS